MEISDEDRIEAFERRIAQGEKIEPGDWMPEAYRQQLIRIISQHAHSEIVGMLPEGAWITRAPNLRQKLVLLAYYNGWSREQLAAKFETPVNTVKTWLRRSMMDIRECLGL